MLNFSLGVSVLLFNGMSFFYEPVFSFKKQFWKSGTKKKNEKDEFLKTYLKNANKLLELQ